MRGKVTKMQMHTAFACPSASADMKQEVSYQCWTTASAR